MQDHARAPLWQECRVKKLTFEEDRTKKLEIYKRPENGGHYSYLAIPEGKMIPEEAMNVNKKTAERSIDFNEDDDMLTQFSIEEPLEQISAKGYAITSIKNLIAISHGL